MVHVHLFLPSVVYFPQEKTTCGYSLSPLLPSSYHPFTKESKMLRGFETHILNIYIDNVSKTFKDIIMKICIQCQKKFNSYIIISNKKIRLNNRKRCFSCSPYIPFAEKQKKLEISCTHCSKIIRKSKKQISKTKNHFCSSSCAARYNNRFSKKRKLSKKCKSCNSLIYKYQTYCSLCWSKNKPDIETNTIGQYKTRSDANRYRSVRDHARKIVKDRPKECQVCNYKTHVELCHIKEISSFPDDATIKTINDHNNLVYLCRNHHWELDHDLIKI